MRTLTILCGCLMLGSAFAADELVPAALTETASVPMHRYLVQRTFPRGAVDGMDAAAKAKINATNAQFGVRWLLSYVSVDRTTTYSVYEGPSKAAVRAAASANGTSIDGITEVPLIVPPK